ncbi:MAG: CehA/McbA family metallohydrolase [Chloroflexota bacterium]
MVEIIGNLHLHTTASDGAGSHAEVAAAAARAGLDFLVYTDHNVAIEGLDSWYFDPRSGREILRLMGQEVNDQNEAPEHSHLLCYFVTDDLQAVAVDPQRLIDTVNERGGICFLAHPLERPGYHKANEVNQTYSWQHWDVSGYTGIELWNAMTDVKWQLRTMVRGVIGAFLPNLVLTAPFPEMLAKWDELLAAGSKIVAIGGADAHAMSFSAGPLRRTILPYEYLFRAVNTHLILAEPLLREVGQARRQIMEALQTGHCFVSYDLIGSSRGFTFTAASGEQQANMGDALELQESATLSVSSPQPAQLRLIKDGRRVAQSEGRQLTWQATEPGVYRVEAYRRFWGWLRGWVFTNPIYLRC